MHTLCHALHARLLAAVMLAAIPLLGGCAAGITPDRPLISAQDAAALVVAGGDVILIDAGWPEDFAQRRLRGSQHADYGAWLARNRRDPAAPDFLDQWAADLATMGIGRRSRIIIYGGRGSYNAPATTWYGLQAVGVERIAVVNGGFDALATALADDWVDRSPLPEATPRPISARLDPFIPRRARPVCPYATKADVIAARSLPGSILLDARSPTEFAGIDDTRNPRPGRIPGAINFPHSAVRDELSLVKSAQEIRGLLAEHGISPGDPLLVYCQGGGRSAFLALALVSAGFVDVRNYFGSFGEWSRDESCPVERDEAAPFENPAPPT